MIVLTLTASASLFFAKPHKTKAFLGFGDIVAINLDDLFKSVAFTIANSLNQRFTRQFMSQALSKMKVQNYDIYTRNLANQVYMTTALKGTTPTKQYVTRVLAAEAGGQPIQDINGNTITGADLVPIFKHQAVEHFNFFDAQKQMYSGTPMAFSLSHAGDLQSNPSNIGTTAATYAVQTSTKALAQAQADTSAANGYKSTYNCGVGNKGPSTKTQDLGKAACVINDPGSFVFNEMQTQIDKLGKQAVQPTNHAMAAWEFAADNFATYWMNRLFNNANGNPISDINYITQPLQQLVESSLQRPQFYIVDDKGNKTYGSDIPGKINVPVDPGSSMTIVWDSSKVLNASSVHLTETSCSPQTQQCPPSGDLPLSGNYTVNYDGNSDTFTLDTYTVDNSGATVLKYKYILTVIQTLPLSGG